MSELWDTFRRTASAHPGKVLVRQDDAAITARELERAAGDAALLLPGNVRGRAVLLQRANSIEWLIDFLALQLAGAIVVPVDPDLPELGQVERAIRRRRIPAGTALVKLTSGSTGVPKPLFFSAETLLVDGRNVVGTMGVEPGDVNLAVIPLGHSYGLGNLVLPLIEFGVPMVIARGFLPRCVAETVASGGVTVFPGVPILFRALLRSGVSPRLLRTVRTFITAGAPLAAELWEAFHGRFGARLHNFYGSSETGGIAYDRSGELGGRGGCVGAPLEGVELRVRARRFWLRSGAVAGNVRRGADNWVGLPDHGRIGPDGEVLLEGRAAGFVKVGGRKVHLAEVERALRGVGGVSDVCVISAERQGVQGVAAVVETDLPSEQVRECFLAANPPWQLPRPLKTLREFPRGTRGKIDRRRLLAVIGEAG